MKNFFTLIDDSPEISQRPFFPRVYLGDDQKVPAAFNARSILIDGRADALLNWKEARTAAVAAISQGLKIFWEIDLGLFSRLSLPLSDQTQFLTLALSLEHFQNSLWEEFKQHTVGLCLYRGEIDFLQQFVWDDMQMRNLRGWLKDRDLPLITTLEELSTDLEGRLLLHLFCRDAATEYLGLLAAGLPDGLMPFVMLDISKIDEELLLAQMLFKGRYEGIGRFVTEGILPPSAFLVGPEKGFCGDEVNEMPLKNIPYGICLPAVTYMDVGTQRQLQELMLKLQNEGRAFRVVHEETLTSEWDGLDTLAVMTSELSKQGVRKLQGFSAAGGRVIDLA